MLGLNRFLTNKRKVRKLRHSLSLAGKYDGFCVALLGIGDCETSNTVNNNQQNNTTLGLSQSQYNSLRQSCSANNQAQNVIDINGSSNVSIKNVKMQNAITTLCVLKGAIKTAQNASAIANLLNSFRNSQDASGIASNNNFNQNLINNLSVHVSQDTINQIQADCIMKINTDNIIKVANSSNVSVDGVQMINSQYNSCLNEQLMDIAQKADIDVTSKNDSSNCQSGTGSMGPLTDIFNSLFGFIKSPGGIIFIVAAVIVLIIILYIYISLRGQRMQYR